MSQSNPCECPGSAESVVMPTSSRYAGQPIDISSRRSIRIISCSDTRTPIAHDQHEVIVDNFFHAGEFWRAMIPLDGVAELFGQAFNFSKPRTRKGPDGPEIVYDRQGRPKRRIPCLNHVQSRLKFKQDRPIRLYRQADIQSPPQDADHLIYDVVYSSEVAGPVGVIFNLRDGMLGDLINAHRFVSTEEIVFERLVVENQFLVESPPIEVDDDVKRALLRESLLRSHFAGMHEPYYLYRVFGTNNCTSTPLQILDRVARYTLWQRLGSLFYRLPMSPRFYLRVRGLDSQPGRFHRVRDEFADFINAPETQQRKRDVVRQRIRATREARKKRS